MVLHYQLGELPSAQHRAGLAGLVLMLQHQQPGPERGVARITQLGEVRASFEFDLEGLRWLFDELYAAGMEERAESKAREGQPPLREEERESKDEKGKVRLKRYFIYEAPVPRAGLLLDLDPTANGRSGHWVKLWRDMVWQTLRGVPASRLPFENRAAGKPTSDAEDAWNALLRPESSVSLSSTDYLGAMDRTADNVSFTDRARFQFLLRFWPFIAQVYVPQKLVLKDDRSRGEPQGYALAIPDVAVLDVFCEEWPRMLRARGVEVLGFRPKEALVDLAVESALKTGQRLRERIARREGASRTSDLVLGYEVFHLDKEGNNVRLYSVARVEPDTSMIDEYEGLRPMLWDPLFRRTRLLNLVERRPWYTGFDRIAATVPYAATFGAPSFRHDARESFKRNEAMSQSETSTPEAALEPLVLQLVRGYVSRRVEKRTSLTWDQVKEGAPQASRRGDYDEARERIARDAFLAVRSRTGQDFVEYFAGTLCSVPHHLGPEKFVLLSRALHERTEVLRTLTLLALSAVG
ncbi:type I-MYXAN CRISPR-associated protein Cmx8 [Cystobacter ferrugineus]|uniref:Type I-MYXAN CRISPR-associated protein Cmx8 n=1 Tax=Cystobacter ferrugineus TaxID=83449 RepID=A0A1L9AVB3_9BACT|nr:type I-MYXAN CRISPR-associated protein Cmx8 [Cystobacter ferrugineus]